MSAQAQPNLYDERASVVGRLQSEIDTVADPRQSYRKVVDTIADIRRRGNTPPDELLALERSLALDCIAASQGR